MSFYKRYELDRLIADGDAKSFRALDTTTGRPVLMHMFNPQGQAVLAALKQILMRGGVPLPPLLEMGEFAGAPYAVTEEIAGFRNVRDWLTQITSSPTAAPPPVQAPQLRAPSQPGSATERFNNLFDSPVKPPAPKPPAPKPPAPKPDQGDFTRVFGGAPEPPRPVPPPVREVGEFTRLFGGPSMSNQPPAKAPSAPPPTQAGPGEFTQVFKLQSPPPTVRQNPPHQTRSSGDDFDRMFGPGASAAAPAPVESKQRDERGQFTNLFGMGQVGESINIEEEARAARSSAPEARPFQAPSEFTRVFGPQGGPNRPVPVVAPKTIGSASQLFGERPGMMPVAQAQPQGPDEFARVIGAPRQPNAGPPVPPANQMPAAPPGSKRSWIVWVAVGVPLLALIIFAIIALVRSRAS